MEIKFIDLFCGIGGFRYGLERCNRGITETPDNENRQEQPSDNRSDGQGRRANTYTCVWSNDNDKYACQIYRKQFGEVCEQDIRTVDPSAIPEHDLLCAGFPCQSFSIAGQRGGFTDTRGTLFFEICRIAGAKRTPYLLLENVKGLLSAPYTKSIEEWIEADFDEFTSEPTTKALKKHKAIPGTKGWVFLTILNSLWELGYGVQWVVRNSKNYGVPQNRERVFIIGHLRGRSRPEILSLGEAGYGDSKLGTEAEERGQGMENGFITPALRGSDKWQTGILSFRYGVMSEKNKKWLEDGKDNSRNFPQGQRVYSTDGISAQLNAQGGGWGAKTGLYETGCQPNRQGENIGLGLGSKSESIPRIRRLTPIECERLQGFPDNWTEGISDTQRYKCLGNAVTVNVIEAIGRQLLNEQQIPRKKNLL